MSDEQILEILKKFDDVLSISNMWNYAFRWVGWFIIQGLSWLVDGLENVTDTILGMKTFFASPKVQAFVTSIQPILYLLLAFSLLWIGYCLIFQRKINREQIVMNIFISIAVVLILNTGMMKANTFTDKAIDAINVSEKSSISQKIIKDHVTDIAQYDVQGWRSTTLKQPNKIPEKNIRSIDITETLDEDFKIGKDESLSDNGKDIISKKTLLLTNGQFALVDLNNGFFDFFKEHYYRFQFDFWTIAISLFVTGMALLFISLKLAKLCYELAFNYILATIIAPADVAGGQMLKQVLKSILNTFIVIVMIFMSMKLYLMGTEYIAAKLSGVPYLIALIAISFALIDGPVLCERLFGIDAGLKSGWSVAASTIATGKAISGGVSAVKNGLGAIGGLASIGGKGAANVLSGLAGLTAGLQEGKGKSGDTGLSNVASLSDEMNSDKKGSSSNKSNDSANASTGLADEMKQDAQNDGNSIQEKEEGNNQESITNGSTNGSDHESVSNGCMNGSNQESITNGSTNGSDHESVSNSSMNGSNQGSITNGSVSESGHETISNGSMNGHNQDSLQNNQSIANASRMGLNAQKGQGEVNKSGHQLNEPLSDSHSSLAEIMPPSASPSGDFASLAESMPSTNHDSLIENMPSETSSEHGSLIENMPLSESPGSGYSSLAESVQSEAPSSDHGSFNHESPIESMPSTQTQVNDKVLSSSHHQVSASSTSTVEGKSKPLEATNTIRSNHTPETRTVSQVVKESTSKKVDHSSTVQQAKRSYQIGRNTSQSWKSKRNISDKKK